MRFIAAAVALSVAVFCLAGMWRSRNSARPFSIAGLTYNAGPVIKGQPVTHVVRITNVGTKPLVLESSVVGCDCTSVDVDHAVVSPGGSRDVHMKLDTGDMEAGTQLRTVDFVLSCGRRTWRETATVSMQVQERPAKTDQVSFGAGRSGIH
jgi:hypothetical protein